MPVVGIHGEPRVIVGADVVTGDAEATEVAGRCSRKDVRADQSWRRAVEVCRPCGGVAGRPAVNRQLLIVDGGGIAVVENHFEVAIRQDLRI